MSSLSETRTLKNFFFFDYHLPQPEVLVDMSFFFEG